MPNFAAFHGRRGRLLLCMAIAFCGAVTLAAQPPDDDEPRAKSKPINRLEGIVISGESGRPLAGVNVAMAHAKDGWISLESRGRLSTFGSDDSILLFFAKRNGRATCEAVTDQDGQFALSSFKSPGDEYTIVAAHAEHGVEILSGVVPQRGSLRIEMRDPAFIQLPDVKSAEKDGLAYNVVVSPVASGENDPDDVFAAMGGRLAPNVTMNYYSFPAQADGGRIGPLPAGFRLSVSYQAFTPRTGAPAVLFERTVDLIGGQTVGIDFRRERGATVAGVITTADGRPLRDVNVLVKMRGKSPFKIGKIGALTDKNGRFSVAGVPPGKHVLELIRYAVRTGPG